MSRYLRKIGTDLTFVRTETLAKRVGVDMLEVSEKEHKRLIAKRADEMPVLAAENAEKAASELDKTASTAITGPQADDVEGMDRNALFATIDAEKLNVTKKGKLEVLRAGIREARANIALEQREAEEKRAADDAE